MIVFKCMICKVDFLSEDYCIEHTGEHTLHQWKQASSPVPPFIKIEQKIVEKEIKT